MAVVVAPKKLFKMSAAKEEPSLSSPVDSAPLAVGGLVSPAVPPSPVVLPPRLPLIPLSLTRVPLWLLVLTGLVSLAGVPLRLLLVLVVDIPVPLTVVPLWVLLVLAAAGLVSLAGVPLRLLLVAVVAEPLASLPAVLLPLGVAEEEVVSPLTPPPKKELRAESLKRESPRREKEGSFSEDRVGCSEGGLD